MRPISTTAMDRFRETARQRRVLDEERCLQRSNLAWAVAKEAAEVLCEQFKARQVIVFGSLVLHELFHMKSDVDLAVWGIDDRHFLRAVAAVTSLEREIEVDLIAMEEAPESLRVIIEKEGKFL